jgi:hypothetical protein
MMIFDLNQQQLKRRGGLPSALSAKLLQANSSAHMLLLLLLLQESCT